MSAARTKQKMSNWEKLKSLVRPRNSFRRWLLIAAVALGLVLVLAFSVMAYADSVHKGEMFPHTYMLGVDITGMTREEAIQALEVALQPMMSPITLQFKDRQWSLTPADFDFTADKESMVEEAYDQGWQRSLLERIFRRMLNKPLNLDIPIKVSYDRDKLKNSLTDIASSINQSVKDGSLEFNNTNGQLTYHAAREGRKMDVEGTLAAVEASLASPDRVLEPLVQITAPSLPDEKVQSVIVVDIMGNTLKLYNKDTLVRTYYCATGMPKFSTPQGKFYIIRKEHDPAWTNPNVDWSKEMPPRIEPGPDNPLGMRALVTDAAGGTVLIHGTRYLEPGLYSHGCIRLANGDIVDLFDRVEVGTPTFIWTSSPIPPPPPDQGPVVGPEDPGLQTNTQ